MIYYTCVCLSGYARQAVCVHVCVYIYSRDLICLNVYFSMFSAMMCSCRAMPDKLFACMIVYMWSGLELFECLFLCFRA